MTTHKFHKTKVKIIRFFSKTKKSRQKKTKIDIKHLIIRLIIFSSDDEDYYNQNHQQFYRNQRLHSYHMSQPDIFQPYTQEQHMQQPRPNLTSQNKRSPASKHSYQPTQMQTEIPLPYYLQQHEITKSQLTNFSKMPNAAESLQMTMNPYLMGGLSITSTKL